MYNLGPLKPVKRHRHDAITTPVTTAAWVQTIASMGVPASALVIFNGTGQILEIAVGSPGSEVALTYYIAPNESTPLLPFSFSNNASVSLRAVDGDATVSSIVFNFYG